MNKIISFNISKLYVKELGTLARNLSLTVLELAKTKQIPSKMVEDLDAAIREYDGAVGKITASEAAQVSAQLDDQRDDVILALKGLAMAAKYRSNETIRSAGRQLEDAIRHRGWQMQAHSYVAETNAITQLLSDINNSPELISAVSTLGADELIAQLQSSNTLFVENEKSRVLTSAAKGKISSQEAVSKLQKTILKVFNYLNSVVGYYPEVDAAINTLNGYIEPFATQLKTRATMASNAKKAEVEQSSTN